MRKLLMVLIMSVLPAATALGGPLLKSQVSSTANWVVHSDYERFNETQIGQLIRAELANQGIEQKLLDFKTVFSFHPIDDVRDVTIYGSGDDKEKGVVLIEGNFDSEKLVALVRMNAEYEVIAYGDIVVHSWVDEKKRDPDGAGQQMYGCIFNDDLVVLGSGLEAVKLAVDVLNGSAANAAGDMFNQPALNAEGAFFQVAANNVDEIAQQQQQAASLKQTDELGMVIGEVEGTLYIDLSLRAKTEEVAQNVHKILDGIIALMTLAGDEKPVLAELAKKLQLSCVDKTVAIHFESESEAILSFLKEQWEKEKQEKSQQQ